MAFFVWSEVCCLIYLGIKLFVMQDQRRRSGHAEADENKFDRTSDLSQHGSEWEDDDSNRLDEPDMKEHHVTAEEEDSIEWEDEDLNRSQQAVDKSPGEERGKGEKVTMKDLKGKQVDADPSTKKGKPFNH
jgi:hypothetical protein